MNTQILHHLAHGDLMPKGDIVRFGETYVEVEDGSKEAITPRLPVASSPAGISTD